MSAHFDRGMALIEHSRLDQAVEEFKQALVEDPNDGMTHAMLALCFHDLNKLNEAEFHAAQAIHLDPEEGLPHHAYAAVLLKRNRIHEAMRACDEALRIDPENAAFWAMRATLFANLERWQDCLVACDFGLEADPAHVDCINKRAVALRMLGRGDEEKGAIETALAHDPENALTHTNAGYSALMRGERKKAMEHFAEALRIEPTDDDAREGLCEALKSANPLYAWFLRWSFWLAKRGRRTNVLVAIAIVVFVQVVYRTTANIPELRAVGFAVALLYGAYVMFGWNGTHLMDFVLQFHPLGRRALAPRNRLAANTQTLLIVGGIASLIVYIFSGESASLFWLMSGIGMLALTFPLATAYLSPAGWPRKLTTILAISCVVLMTGAVALALAQFHFLALLPFGLGGLGCIAATWIGLLTRNVRPAT